MSLFKFPWISKSSWQLVDCEKQKKIPRFKTHPLPKNPNSREKPPPPLPQLISRNLCPPPPRKLFEQDSWKVWHVKQSVVLRDFRQNSVFILYLEKAFKSLTTSFKNKNRTDKVCCFPYFIPPLKLERNCLDSWSWTWNEKAALIGLSMKRLYDQL